MNLVLIICCLLVASYIFIKKREYILAALLVGQPILKLFLKPFPDNNSIYLLIYFALGFYVLCIVRFTNRRTLKLKNTSIKMIILILVFSILMFISLIYTPDRTYGLTKSIDFFSTIFLIVTMTVLSIDDENSLYRSMNAIANISLIVGLITIILIYAKTGNIVARIGTTQAQEIQIIGINFSVSIWFGRRIGLGFLSMLYITLMNRNTINRLKTALLLFLLILSGSRGPIISMGVSLFCVVLINIIKKTGYRKYYKKILLIMFLFTIVFTFYLIINNNNIFARLLDFNDDNALSRVEMYVFSIDLIKNNILGLGVGSFKYFFNDIHEYPHNIILEILLELGFQSFFVFCLLIVDCFRYYFRAIKFSNRDNSEVYINYAITILFFALVNAMFSGNIISNEFIWFSFIMISRIIDLIKCQKQRNCIKEYI